MEDDNNLSPLNIHNHRSGAWTNTPPQEQNLPQNARPQSDTGVPAPTQLAEDVGGSHSTEAEKRQQWGTFWPSSEETGAPHGASLSISEAENAQVPSGLPSVVHAPPVPDDDMNESPVNTNDWSAASQWGTGSSTNTLAPPAVLPSETEKAQEVPTPPVPEGDDMLELDNSQFLTEFQQNTGQQVASSDTVPTPQRIHTLQQFPQPGSVPVATTPTATLQVAGWAASQTNPTAQSANNAQRRTSTSSSGSGTATEDEEEPTQDEIDKRRDEAMQTDSKRLREYKDQQ
eukprot:3920707-Rhodomonas_salina.1